MDDSSAGVDSLERDRPSVEALARRTIRTFPQSPRPHMWLVVAVGQIGWPDEARMSMHAAIAASPTYFGFSTRGRPVLS
jgi:hypothetical protein